MPGREPQSTLTHSLSLCAEQPILAAIEEIATISMDVRLHVPEPSAQRGTDFRGEFVVALLVIDPTFSRVRVSGKAWGGSHTNPRREPVGQEQANEIVASLGEIERKCERMPDKIDRSAESYRRAELNGALPPIRPYKPSSWKFTVRALQGKLLLAASMRASVLR
jgi:hypothetical protein